MLRSTFREKTDICWQKLLRDKYAAEGTPPVPHLDLKRAIVRRVSRALARQIILKYEWLGTLPPCTAYYGIFFGSYCAGVVCFIIGAVGAGNNVHREIGIKREELAYLVRGANVHWSPPGANSKLVSIACKLLARDYPSVKAVIAYSDTDAGEIGTIYQACNWVYIGKGGAPGQIVAPNGRIYDVRNISSWARQRKVSWCAMRDALLRAGWRE